MGLIQKLIGQGVTIHESAKHGPVWMLKRKPGEYFRPPQEGKPLEFVSEEIAAEVGFDVRANRRRVEYEKRMAASRQRVERDLRIEEIRVEMELSPPFTVQQKGAGSYMVLDSSGEPQSDRPITKSQAEELAALLNEKALQERLAAEGLTIADAEAAPAGATKAA